MQTVYTVIRDTGDGSQSVEWRKNWSDEIHEKLEQDDSYQSGDGVQVREIHFPDGFDLDMFAKVNYIGWSDGSENEEY